MSVGLCRFQAMCASKRELKSELDCIHTELSTVGSPVVLCHNDLLFKNIIYDSQRRMLNNIICHTMTPRYILNIIIYDSQR